MVEKLGPVLYSKHGPIAYIVLNRPGLINAYNVQMRDELFQALEAVCQDPEVRVAIFTGTGSRGFCAGADLSEFSTAPSLVASRRVRWDRDVWGLFLKIKKPLIAALHGYVIGSGLEMACLCDIRIASEDTTFRMPEVALGMIPAAGGTQTIARAMGLGPTMEMLLTNRQVTAWEAKRLGLVHEVVPTGAHLIKSKNIAQTLALRSTAAMAAVKTAILEGMDLPLTKGLELEERLVVRVLKGSQSSASAPPYGHP